MVSIGLRAGEPAGVSLTVSGSRGSSERAGYPSSKVYVVPVEIEPLEDGAGFLATSEAIQGCLAEGRTVV